MDPEEKQQNYELAERLLSEQNFGSAAIAGVVAMILEFDVLLNTSVSEISGWMLKDLPFAELMFWVIGIGGAAYFARRPLTREEGLALYTYEMRR